MTSILFHVLPPIHREILVVAATLSRAKQRDGKSFSLVRREAKMYIYIYTHIFPVLASIYSIYFLRSNFSLASRRLFPSPRFLSSLHFKSFHPHLSLPLSFSWFEVNVAVARDSRKRECFESKERRHRKSLVEACYEKEETVRDEIKGGKWKRKV